MTTSIRTEIITIGDEILIGQTIDSNSAWLGQNLDLLGYQIVQISSIADQSDQIVKALDLAKERADLIIITGGLGPTLDDRTKQTLADYFGMKLIVNDLVMHNIKKILNFRNYPFLQSNMNQALVPEGCMVLNNVAGTAPGMLFQQDSKVIVSLPGVPFEMKTIAENELFPWLLTNLQSEPSLFKMIMTTGFGESILASKLEDWETNLPDHMSLAYLPSPGLVKLRLTAQGKPQEELIANLNFEIEKLNGIIPEAIYSYKHESLEERVGEMLKAINKSVGTVESCTGGTISSLLTSIPGSSAYYKGSIVGYAYETKRDFIGIDQHLLNTEGAVSQSVITQMADQGRRKLNLDYVIASSGIAGPEGGTDEKPVGLVWLAVASSRRIVTKKFHFGNNRSRIITRASLAGLNMLRELIIDEYPEINFVNFHKST